MTAAPTGATAIRADWPIDRPLDLGLTLGPLRRARHDPTVAMIGDSVWRATRTPDGPATVRLRVEGSVLVATAWGPGASWAAAGAPGHAGLGDDDDTFHPAHPLLADLHRRYAGLRIPRTEAVLEALLPTILEQKVTGLEARRSYVALSRALGEPAPGPAGAPRTRGGLGLLLPPAPATLAHQPSWAFHAWGIEEKRADTIRRAATLAARLEEAAGLPPPAAQQRLCSVPGIGPWTAAEVALVALGDADAVSVGDYHLPHMVAWALAGQARADDDRMLELLEPYRGHRGRVLRLLAAARLRAPRYGPRMAPRDIRTI